MPDGDVPSQIFPGIDSNTGSEPDPKTLFSNILARVGNKMLWIGGGAVLLGTAILAAPLVAPAAAAAVGGALSAAGIGVEAATAAEFGATVAETAAPLAPLGGQLLAAGLPTAMAGEAFVSKTGNPPARGLAPAADGAGGTTDSTATPSQDTAAQGADSSINDDPINSTP